MASHRLVLSFTVIIGFIFSCSATVIAGEHILVPKIGMVDRNDNINHRANNDSFDFDDDTVLGHNFTYLYRLDNGFAFGAEIFGYQNDIVTTANNNGDVITTHIYGVIEKIFNTEGDIKPFVGAGLGAVSMLFDANINGEIDDGYGDVAIGLSYELYAGVEFELSNKLGLIVEYKYFDLDLNDDIGDKNIDIESDGSAIFVGVAIHL